MAKNIAFFSDGTWNGPGQDENGDGVPDATNVFKLYNEAAGIALSQGLENEQEKTLSDAGGASMQVTKYIHGVGDSGNVLIKILAGTFGAGIVERIVRGYTFVSRNYAPDDRIFLIGFSRGAYTVRALAGMIAKVGLLDRTKLDLADKEAAYRYGVTAWTQYRRAAKKTSGLLDYLEDYVASDIPSGALLQNVGIRAIGVWDTVGSLGIPMYADDDRRLDLFRFADTVLHPRVDCGFHALAIDEQRADFSPTHWDPRENVEERWFAGAHADVGGGYAETGLSDVALAWMKGKLASVGLLFSQHSQYRSQIDELAPIHEPWNGPLWRAGKRYVREISTDALLDDSVKRRLQASLANYPTRALELYLAAVKSATAFA